MPGRVEHLGVADHGVGVDEVIRRGRNQQDFGAHRVHRKFDVQPFRVLEVFFQEGAVVFPGRGPDAQVVPGVVDLGHDLGDILGGDPRRGHDLPRGHGDLRGVDPVGAEDRAAAAFAALVEIGVPVLKDGIGQLFGLVGPSPDLSPQGEISLVDFAEKVGPGHGHILRVPRTRGRTGICRRRPRTSRRCP